MEVNVLFGKTVAGFANLTSTTSTWISFMTRRSLWGAVAWRTVLTFACHIFYNRRGDRTAIGSRMCTILTINLKVKNITSTMRWTV
jgi:hypothetical protein